MPAAPRDLSRDELEDLFQKYKNWGRWGSDDQRGCLNLITPEVVRAGSAQIKDGTTVSCSLDLATTPAAENPRPVTHFTLSFAMGDRGGSGDYFGISFHGTTNT